MTTAKKDILQGWKDIAAYVSRDVRTVKRWEKQRGLPVRRMPGIGRANVYALIPELDSWLSAGGTSEPGTGTSPADGNPSLNTAATTETSHWSTAPSSEAPTATPSSAFGQVSKPGPSWIIAAAGVLCLGAIAAFAFGIRAHRRDRADAETPPLTATVSTLKHRSKQPGVDALYLRGIYFYEQRTPASLERALTCFKDAIAKDPSYAPPYAGLAETYNLIREYSMMPEAEAYDKAKAAARQAIALDPNLPEAHAALGFAEFFWDWKPAEAEQEFQTAIALDPNSALVHHWYGSMLTHEGRFSESLVQLELAQHLQPTSTSIISDRAYALGLSGHRDEAIEMLQAVIGDDARSPAPHYILATLSTREPRDLPRYFAEMRRFSILRHDVHGLQMLDELEPAFRKGDATALWHAVLEREHRLHPNDSTFAMVDAEAALGLRDEALRDLEQLAARHDSSLIGMVIDSNLASLRQDPRFIAVVAKTGVPMPQYPG